ncbi:MAG: NACHT domain-containing protein [Planctomycetaceae bacterium]|nr:MAG: NACHT domain-containing protein [Planctomycetaceae bacterium]
MPIQLVELQNQVVRFFGEVFEGLFITRLLPDIQTELDRKRVRRQIDELADTASQSLSRFLSNKDLSEATLRGFLDGLKPLTEAYDWERIANPNETHEVVAAELLEHAHIPPCAIASRHENTYRLVFGVVTQAVMRVAPVLADWKRYSFSRTYEVPRQLNARLEQIAEQYETLGTGRIDSVDERFELTYRDYLMQRFLGVEAGTVRMATNLNVDLKTLFVMPRVRLRKVSAGDGELSERAGDDLLMLSDVKRQFAQRVHGHGIPQDASEDSKDVQTAWEAAQQASRAVLIGPPGAGKSTFLEWVQLQVAEAKDYVLVSGVGQAIPILLRVRQFGADPPTGREMVAKATASEEWANEMPAGWVERQMKKGRVLLMNDGLDETEPEVRDQKLLPWLKDLCKRYPKCRYLVSSRPVGYPPDWLKRPKFQEFDVEDFTQQQIAEYAQHWCTAVRLARNEPASEAQREGQKDGQSIVEQVREHPYIRDLARNPLMLSAICLVNAFEHGRLPDDRVILYRMCVEGLLHNWDQRRGIRSSFSLTEKLRACREVAIAMQAEGRAESPENRIRQIFAKALGRAQDAETLLQHIRYRTGLLLERRPAVFAFAHLTFQEYLAALAVDQGNELKITRDELLRDYADTRWREVLPLLCGMSSRQTAREVLEQLISFDESLELAEVLNDAYWTSLREIGGNKTLRQRVLTRILELPAAAPDQVRFRGFSEDELTKKANALLGRTNGQYSTSNSYWYLLFRPESIEFDCLWLRVKDWKQMSPITLAECVHLLHRHSPAERLASWTQASECYRSPGPNFSEDVKYKSQASIALLGLTNEQRVLDVSLARVLVSILDSMIETKDVGSPVTHPSDVPFRPIDDLDRQVLQQVKEKALEFVAMVKADTDDRRSRQFGRVMLVWTESLGSPSASDATKKRKASSTKVSTRSRTKKKK